MHDGLRPIAEDGPLVPGGALSIDQLDYMADLISELCEMARRADEPTLSALLALAEAEASREAVRRRSQAAR